MTRALLFLAVVLVALCAPGCLRVRYRDEPTPQVTGETLERWRLAGINIARQIGRGDYASARFSVNLLTREIGQANVRHYRMDTADTSSEPAPTPPIDKAAPTLARAADALKEAPLPPEGK